jgi:hypothetical protein
MPWTVARRCLLVGLWLAFAPAARADEFYYVMVFGSQRDRPCVKHSHTFAVFVKATGYGRCAEDYALEGHTISWYPETLELRPAALLPECGRNFDLGTTLRVAAATGQRVSMWGPYQIDRELYERALRQIALLQSGEVCYKTIDSGYPSDRVCNCIHAVSSVADGHLLCVLSPGYGESASRRVTERFRPWMIDPYRRHDWVASRLGLDAWPLLRCNLPSSWGIFRSRER